MGLKSQTRITEHARVHAHAHVHTHYPRQMDLSGEKGIICSDDSLNSSTKHSVQGS